MQTRIERLTQRKRILRNLTKRKAIAEHVAYVGGIGLPSKMPGTAYGISAKQCATGGKLQGITGSVCERCYAMGANYTYPSVAQAHAARLESLRNLGQWIDAWGHILEFLGSHLPDAERYHRWHDSGDLQSTEHLGAICEVARRNPGWRFWLPTKEYAIVRKYTEQWAIPGNLVVRVSMPMRDQESTVGMRNLTGCTSTVGNVGGFQCPAKNQDGFCDACRKCWDKAHANTNYPLH